MHNLRAVATSHDNSRTLLRAVRNIEHLIEADLVFADHVDGLHHEIEAALRVRKSCASDVTYHRS